MAKFAAIKLIIFFTWWQSICLSVMVEFHLLNVGMFAKKEEAQNWTQNDVAQALQDLIICFEMVIFAVAHHFIFPVPNPIDYDQTTRQDWESRPGAGFGQQQTYQNLMTAVTLTDLVHDAQDVQKPVPMESYQSYLGRYIETHKHIGSQGF